MELKNNLRDIEFLENKINELIIGNINIKKDWGWPLNV
jgi:GDP-D-mannose dehydratase